MYRTAVIGAGIVGLAAARALPRGGAGELVVVEAEAEVGFHQTGHNSGVIHSGLYYRPGSLKARTCVEGREQMYAYCREHGIPHEPCGKLVLATTDEELGRLAELERVGRANGLEDLRILEGEELRDREPHAGGIRGLWVPQTGIVDFRRVATVIADELRRSGVEILTGAGVTQVSRRSDGWVLRCGEREIQARNLLNCGGLHADRLARMTGLRPDVRILPFRGEYFKLAPARRHLVRGLIYPVPDPRFPFLGVHFTRTIHGEVEVGPNAVPALSRTGYSRFDFVARDAVEILASVRSWRLGGRYWRTGLGELYRSVNKRALARELGRLVPEIEAGDLSPGGSGVRAQAVGPDGRLLDDFQILEGERMLHVLNAPSPAATASLCIGHTLAVRAAKVFDL